MRRHVIVAVTAGVVVGAVTVAVAVAVAVAGRDRDRATIRQRTLTRRPDAVFRSPTLP